MALRKTAAVLGTSWGKAVEFLPQKFRLDHGPDQYGVDRHFYPEEYPLAKDPESNLSRGRTPSTESKVYNPIKEPFLVPPKYRKPYNFSTGHGKYLYSKDPLWVEARERYWDDLQISLQVHRKNYDDLRKKYRKQWQDAHRYNLDEYLTVMNRVKLEEKVERELSEERRTKEWEADLARIDAINLLQEKRRRMIMEHLWKVRVWQHERYSEQLQYMTKYKVNDFITFENIDAKLEHEATKWSRFGGEINKLNMFGRIPYDEDEDCKPNLELQYVFMEQGSLSENGREAFARLGLLDQNMQRGSDLFRVRADATYADFSFDESTGDSGLDTTGNEAEPEEEQA